MHQSILSVRMIVLLHNEVISSRSIRRINFATTHSVLSRMMFMLVGSSLLILAVSVDSRCVVTFSERSSGIGVQNATFNNVRYCEYRGVRYATAARFEDPVLHNPNGQEQYKREGSSCPQLNEFYHQQTTSGDEDCLFMNVFVPQFDRKKAGFGGFPVLVFIHGGSFQIGSASFEFDRADLLIEKVGIGANIIVSNSEIMYFQQIIVISINYRLDVLGFLHYPLFNITGNYGLKDQQAALKWINRYIKFFGGDPNKVTLMGQSAGAASVSYHLYSDRSRGLFQQAALLSGSFLADWAYTYRPEHFAEEYFKHFGFNSRQQLLDRNASDFIELNYWQGAYFFNRYNTWPLPTAEADDDPSPFLTASPQELIIRKRALDVPLLVGITIHEFELVRFPLHTDHDRLNIPNRWNNDVWSQLRKFTEVNVEQFIEKGWVSNRTDFILKLSNSMNAIFPVEHTWDQMIARGHSAPIFAFRFDFDGKFGRYKNDRLGRRLRSQHYGAIHGDDLGYIFTPYCVEEALASRADFRKEWAVHDRMTEMVANFVKHG